MNKRKILATALSAILILTALVGSVSAASAGNCNTYAGLVGKFDITSLCKNISRSTLNDVLNKALSKGSNSVVNKITTVSPSTCPTPAGKTDCAANQCDQIQCLDCSDNSCKTCSGNQCTQNNCTTANCNGTDCDTKACTNNDCTLVSCDGNSCNLTNANSNNCNNVTNGLQNVISNNSFSEYLKNLLANCNINIKNIDQCSPIKPTATPSAPAATPSAPAATPSAPAATPAQPTATPSAPVKTPSLPTPTPVATANPAPNGGKADNLSFEEQVVVLVNKERAAYGLAPLTLNEKLSNVARAKSQDMKDNRYFSHTSPTYGSPFDMMRSFGITYRTAGENIAMGYATPEAVMKAWMNSEGHRANILNASYTQIGVGYVASGNYWTQHFIG